MNGLGCPAENDTCIPLEDDAVNMPGFPAETDACFAIFSKLSTEYLGCPETNGTFFTGLFHDFLSKAWLSSREVLAKSSCSPFLQKLGCFRELLSQSI